MWTHHLKSFDYLPSYSSASYQGRAAHLGAGLESWELHGQMAKLNVTILAPGWSTVGNVGGWMLGGGHTTVSGMFGLGADQVIELNVVTADGRFVAASAQENQDLFFALRGAGLSMSFFLAKCHLGTSMAVGEAGLKANDDTELQAALVSSPRPFFEYTIP